MKVDDEMICKYSYKLKNEKVTPEYQADVEDFKKLFKNPKFRNEVSSIVVKLPDSIFIWTPKTKNKYSGWQKVK